MEKSKTLAIRGKVINIEKIDQKSVAQFGAQLHQNGIDLDKEELENIHASLVVDRGARREKLHQEAEARKAQKQAERDAKREAHKAKLNPIK